MRHKKSKATRRSISVLKQIVSGELPGWRAEDGEEVEGAFHLVK